MPRHLSTMALVAIVLCVIDLVLTIAGVSLGIPLPLTTIAVILLCLGILIKV